VAPEVAEKQITAEAFWTLPCPDGWSHELVRGTVIEMVKPGGRHGKHATRIIAGLLPAADEAGGIVLSEVGFLLQRNPDTVRAPDVAYLRPGDAHHVEHPTFITVPPTIAVEVNSPSDAASDVIAKARWWIDRGVEQVWVVDAPSQTVTVYLPGGEARVYGHDDTLDAGETLPGFELPLARLFD